MSDIKTVLVQSGWPTLYLLLAGVTCITYLCHHPKSYPQLDMHYLVSDMELQRHMHTQPCRARARARALGLCPQTRIMAWLAKEEAVVQEKF